MCKEVFRTVLYILLSSTLIAAVITIYQENSRRKKQNKYQDAKANLPILIEILEDLNILEQAYVFRGVFCPPLEHRAPHLSDKDGDGVTNMSYAQRGRQFQLIGYRIIRNCRKVIFLTPINHLRSTLETCKDIKNFLCLKKTRDSKTHLDQQIMLLIGILPHNNIDREQEIKVFTEKLHQFYDALDAAIEKELPRLSE